MNGLLWLASYPRSGNTWMRLFLANAEAGAPRPTDINAIPGPGIAGDRSLLDYLLGAETSDLTDDELERFRPAAYRVFAANAAKTIWMKIHDAYTLTSAGEPLVPADASCGVIYLVREPRDVAVSFAHHAGVKIDAVIERMADPSAALSGDARRLREQVSQRLLTWSGHVRSWVDQDAIPKLVLRYEDMVADPLTAFGAAARFAGLSDDPDGVARAVSHCSFGELSRQESERGFKERLRIATRFFRSGRAGAWRETLTTAQAARIVADHGGVMERFGYLDGSCQ